MCHSSLYESKLTENRAHNVLFPVLQVGLEFFVARLASNSVNVLVNALQQGLEEFLGVVLGVTTKRRFDRCDCPLECER